MSGVYTGTYCFIFFLKQLATKLALIDSCHFGNFLFNFLRCFMSSLSFIIIIFALTFCCLLANLDSVINKASTYCVLLCVSSSSFKNLSTCALHLLKC